MIIGDDIEACADLLRPTLALYVGGMGARDRNFHKDVFARLGYEEACDKRSEEHTSELQSLMRISYAVFCLKKKKHNQRSNLLTQDTSTYQARQTTTQHRHHYHSG